MNKKEKNNMTKLHNYLEDGANYQAKCVLIFLQRILEEDDEKRIAVGRWENCREQGYVISFHRHDKISDIFPQYKSIQMNIAWFEHRNSDSIHAIKWEQNTINTPTIDIADFTEANIYKDSFDTSYQVTYKDFMKMAEWIKKQIDEFYENIIK
jgi:hypothetical protein